MNETDDRVSFNIAPPVFAILPALVTTLVVAGLLWLVTGL